MQNMTTTKKLRTTRTIEKVDTWEECRDICNSDDHCDQFNYKVTSKALRINVGSFSVIVIYLQLVSSLPSAI